MKILGLTLTLFFFVIGVPVHAGGWTGTNTISSVRVIDNGYIVVSFENPIPNPDGCNNSNDVTFGTGTAGYEALVSIVYTALVSGLDVSFFVDGCSAGNGGFVKKIQTFPPANN